jgi:hypothetical protein
MNAFKTSGEHCAIYHILINPIELSIFGGALHSQGSRIQACLQEGQANVNIKISE